MGNLAAALSEQARPVPGPKCSVGQLLNELDDIDAQALRNALESNMRGESISTALRGEGHRIAGTTIQRHRRNRCSCGAN